MFPIFVCSKGRPHGSTMRLLRESCLPYTLVVEPQEASAYADADSTASLLVLPESGRGLMYSRQFVLDECRAYKLGWYWLLDDDIQRFSVVRGERCEDRPAADVLGLASDWVERQQPGLAVVGLEYRQYAWQSRGRVTFNSFCDVAVAVHSELTRPLRYSVGLPLKGDRDFVLQVLCSGRMTARLGPWCFHSPPNGSNLGGLKDVYQSGREADGVAAMVAKWGPSLCERVVKPDGRVDLKVNWSAFRQSKPSKPCPRNATKT